MVTVSPSSGPQISVPVQVNNSSPGESINNPLSHGRVSFGAALTNGAVWTWNGGSSHGELGNGTTGHSYTGTMVPKPDRILRRFRSAGLHLALKSSRRTGVEIFPAANRRPELRNRSNAVQEVLNVSNIIAVSGGDDHSSARRRRHRLEVGTQRSRQWKWNTSNAGQSGSGKNSNRLIWQ